MLYSVYSANTAAKNSRYSYLVANSKAHSKENWCII